MYDAIVIPGGGIKGITLLGMLHFLYTQKSHNFKYFSGTSIGTVISALLLVGFTPLEIFTKIDILKDLLTVRWENIVKIIENKGLKDINEFVGEVMFLIEEKTGLKNMTLKELYILSGKMFYFTTYNLSTEKIEYKNPIDDDDLYLEMAIKMSCNIPFVFKSLEHNNHYYIDGYPDNTPITPLLKHPDIKRILVLKINTKKIKTVNEMSIFEYFYRVLNLGSNSKKSLNNKVDYYEIEADDKQYNLLKLNGSLENKQALFDDGFYKMKEVVKYKDELEYFLSDNF